MELPTAAASARVFIVAPVAPPYGGMSLQAEKLAWLLSGEGVQVTVVPTNPSPPRGLGFTRNLPGVRTFIRELQYLAALRRISRQDGVIHHLSASGLYFFLHSVPLILMARPARRILILNYRGGAAAAFLHRWGWLALPFLRHAHRVVVPSPFLQRVFEGHRLNCSLLPNIADTASFAFRQRQPYRPRLLVTRHLEPMYDVESVLRAFRIVQTRYPEAILGIAGSGSQEARLRSLAREWELRGVTFHGVVSSADLPALYAQHDIYVNGSQVDNFPGALLEAACSGLPVVTTNAGGIREMIRHGENGLLSEVGDFRGLAANVLALLEDQDLARRLATHARAWCGQYSWEAVFPALMECYQLSPMTRSVPRSAARDVLV